MKKTYFTIPSSDERTILQGLRFEPDKAPVGVVQLVHGEGECMDRYLTIAEALCEEGYAVIGCDLLGHGSSVVSERDYGYFAEKNGGTCLMKDLRRVTIIAQKLWPDKPVFLAGYRMGSFLAFRYAALWPENLKGLILSETDETTVSEARMWQFAAGAISSVFGPRTRSVLLDRIPEKPLRGSHLTAEAAAELMKIRGDLASGKDFDRIPRSLPVLILAPLTADSEDQGRESLQVYNRLIAMGMKDTDVFFYSSSGIHSLKGISAEDLCDDCIGWMDQRLI